MGPADSLMDCQTGVELRHQPERTRTYLGSPSLVRAPDGALVASHDYFGPGCPRNHEGEEALTSVYRSVDDGRSWRCITHVMNCYWSSLFTLADSLYLLGVSQQYGSILIRRSDDGGFTWTHPEDENSGLLAAGGPHRDPPNYHCAPMPVLFHNRRLYRAFEDCTPNVWGSGFRALVLSAPVEADLLCARNWRMSPSLAFDPDWGLPAGSGWLEGNMVADRKGQLWNILRCHAAPRADVAARIRVDEEGRRLAFSPDTGFLPFPGGHSKFTIRFDAPSDWYLALVNDSDGVDGSRQRNRLSLSISRDLRHWRVLRSVLEDQSGLTPADSRRLTGFQYVDWQMDGDDLIFLVRTAWRGAPNYHDSNRIVFHRLANARAWLPPRGEDP